MTTQTLETVLRTVRHYKLLSSNQTLIVGVSGGTDSLALLHILSQLRDKLQIQLHVATLDHGIRGALSEADVQFVCRVAEQWHIPYTRGYRDVPQLSSEKGIGIEEAGRIARYDFLAQVAQEQAADGVAVAHHANDQAETILMHIIRGSGLNGLRGMEIVAPMPNHEEIQLIRPLLNVTREELERYCEDHQLQPRHDETNTDTSYQRNYIRHEILPRLQTINPSVVDALLRLSDNAKVDDIYLSQLFEANILPHITEGEDRWYMPLRLFINKPLALQRRFVLRAFETLCNGTASLSVDHVSHVVELAQSAQVGKMLDLGQGIRCRLGYDDLFIEHTNVPLQYEEYILLPERTDDQISPYDRSLGIDRRQLYDVVLTFSDKQDLKESLTIIEIADNSTLRLRTRRNGDRFRPKGMGGHSRKLKDWMIDRKIPRQIRDRIPLLTVDSEIVVICVGNTWHLSELAQAYVNANRKIYLTLS